MATPVPGREAVDNGNGTATTFYTDGSSTTWRIDSGQFVSSTPATSGANGVQPVAGATQYPYVGTYAQNFGGGTVAPSTWGAANPQTGQGAGWGTIGAGTAGTQYGYGIPGFGQAPLTINPNYQQYLSNPAVAPGYVPGSGTYNQFRLDQPFLFGTEFGQPVNYQYGSGGPGDPTTGREAQTQGQQNWMQGGRLFAYPGANLEDRYSPLGNLFVRSDTDSGLGSPNVPDWAKPLLLEAIQSGRLTPTARGQQYLQQVLGIAPQQYGNKVTGNLPGAQTGTMGGGGGASGSDKALQDYYASITANAQAMQAAQLAYQDWYQRTQDDKFAFEKAKEAWSQTFQQAQFDYKQKQDRWALEQSAGYFTLDGQRTPTLAGQLQEANLTGRYNGAPTFQREQFEANQMQGLLGLQAGLRGPENYSQYLKVLGSTPQGMRDIVNAAAGRFTMPSTTGVTPGQGTNAADVQSLLRDVTSGGAQAQQEWQQALSGGLPNPNQINTAAWSRMLPTQQKMLLSAYEGSGWEPSDVQAMIRQASPESFAGGSTGTFRF